MNTGTYGLGSSIRGPSGTGPGLAGVGQGQQQLATNMLGQAAREETERNLANQRAAAQQKAGNAQMGSSAGAMAGMSIGGPWGALIGGVLGGIAGGEF